MIPGKNSIGSFLASRRISRRWGATLGLTLSIVLGYTLSNPPVLASPANRQPPPPVIAAVRQAAGRRAGGSPESWQVRSATPRTWPDGCLGLPNPDEICTQSLVEGWEIVVTDQRTTWTYRTDSTGRNTRPAPNK